MPRPLATLPVGKNGPVHKSPSYILAQEIAMARYHSSIASWFTVPFHNVRNGLGNLTSCTTVSLFLYRQPSGHEHKKGDRDTIKAVATH